jgi:hypothetical protein
MTTLESKCIFAVVEDKCILRLPSALESAELCSECVLTGLTFPSLVAIPSGNEEVSSAVNNVSANGAKSVEATLNR